MSIEPGYLTGTDLISGRGWTRGLIKLHLGPPDRLFAVDHWLNWSGKKAWHIQTVELVEMTQGFEVSFLRSAKLRKMDRCKVEEVVDRIYALREGVGVTPERIEADDQQLLRATCGFALEQISDARIRGFRTPHKC